MVRTSSTMLPLGTFLPSFELAVVQGTNLINQEAQNLKNLSSQRLSAKPILLMVICAHCPFVKHLERGISQLAEDYGEKVQFLAVSSNSLLTPPQDGPEYLAEQANKQAWRFPYLLDIDQSLAKALKAACTPDFFLFSPSLKGVQQLRYRGQFDDSRPGNNVPVTGEDLRVALDEVLQGRGISIDQKPSIGCNIKWTPGKEPSWFG